MLLESALFLHPHIASALVGQIAGGVTHIAKNIGEHNKPKKEVFKADHDGPSLDGEIEGNGDDYDPWACSSDSDCPSEPFEYECIGGRCVPVLPERVVDDSSMRNVMKDEFKCWTAVGTMQRLCSANHTNWKKSTYPTDSFGGRSGQAARIKIGTNLDNVPASKVNWNDTLDDITRRKWFGKVRLDTLPATFKQAEDSDDWSFWLGGPLVWSGFVNGGMEVTYNYKKITQSTAGAKPHQFLNKIPSGVPQSERSDFRGMGPITEDYNLTRNSTDYGWGDWITSDWQKSCGTSLFGKGGRLAVVCCTVDCRCFSRVRYKATIVPDPMDSRFINTSNGQISGAIYGVNASANGVQPHTLKIEIESQDTSGTFTTSFKPAAGDEYEITVYQYGSPVQKLRATTDGDGKAIFAFPFQNEGLYQFTVDRKISGNGCVVNQPNLSNEYFSTVSPYFINFGVFVSPPPPKRGCTDPESPNYDPDAKINDGSCTSGFDFGGGGTETQGGGKGDTGFVNRFVDTENKMFSGVALAGGAFLGLVILSSFFSGGDD